MPLWKAIRQERLTPNELLSRFEIKEAPIPVESLVERLGVSLYKTQGMGCKGALRITKEAACIWVDDSKPQAQQRFAIAKEFGHLVLPTLGEYQDVNSTDLKNVEANIYATELLIPGWMLRAYMQSTIDIAKLSRCFGVPEPVMARRIKSYFRL